MTCSIVEKYTVCHLNGCRAYGCPHGIAYREICEWIPPTGGGGQKRYSPGEIITNWCLNANNLKLSFGAVCQVAENAEPRNSLAPKMRATISLGNSGNLSGGQMFLALVTGHTIPWHQWVVLPMSPTVIAEVNLLGNVEPPILTFTNQRGWEIGDNPQG